MKPIKLSFCGLHSYQDRQEVDFEVLGSGGVFGIFGPTGSGKSTILDAITLALFGRVERASNKTQGILNQSAQRLDVCFAFALGPSENKTIYRVERAYTRHGDITVRSTMSRLTRLTQDEPVVIADKDGEVTRSVSEILGLTVDDFTRAVVLPQGKFAEFLSLKGTERRQMLQRLFSLEQYGDRLGEKVRQRLHTTIGQLKQIEGRQDGLGDVSDTKVEEAKALLAETSSQERTIKQSLIHMEKEVRRWDERWGWEQELAVAQAELATLHKQSAAISCSRQELDAARDAEKFRHHLTERAQLKQRQETETKNLEQLQAQLVEMDNKQKAAGEDLHAAKTRRHHEEPDLLAGRHRYQQALGVEQELQEGTRIGQRLEAAWRAKRDALAQMKTDEQAWRQKESEQKQARATIQAKMVETSIASKHRTKIGDLFSLTRDLQKSASAHSVAKQHAATAQNDHHKAQKLVQSEEARYRSCHTSYVELEQRVEKLSQHPPEIEGELAKDQRWLDGLTRLVADLKKNADRVIETNDQIEEAKQRLTEKDATLAMLEQQRRHGEQQMAHLQTEQENQERQALAAQLAADLVDDSPCPVCGSTAHPHKPIVPTGVVELGPKIATLQKKNESLLEKLGEMRALVAGERQALHELDKRVVDLQAEETYLRSELIASLRDQSPDELEETVRHQKDALDDRERDLANWKQTLAQTQLDVKTLRQQREEQTEVLQRLRKQETEKETAGKLAKESLQQAAEHWEAYRQQFDDKAQGMTVEQVVAEYQRVAACDKAYEEHHQKLRVVEQSLEELQTKISRITQQIQLDAQDVAKRETQREENERAVDKCRQLLSSLLQGQPTAQAGLDDVNARLQALQETQTRLEHEHQQLTEQATTQRDQVNSAQTTLQITKTDYQHILHTLERHVAVSPFATLKEAEDALRNDDVQTQLKQTIDAYERTSSNLMDRCTKLENALGDQRITEEEWQGWQVRLQDQQETHQQLVRAVGGLEQQLSSLQASHAQWKELEKERREVAYDHEVLHNLQQVLRGNAFVEYLAEQQLSLIAREASERLGQLTKYRYALEIDSVGGFVMRDDAHGGVRRPVNTLSGGETFLASLSLAFALSNQIQLRGQYPLEFFFLDEGFGTLDPELLDTVFNVLEGLQLGSMSIGIISHVAELRQRLTRRILVEPAQPGRRGSTIQVELA